MRVELECLIDYTAVLSAFYSPSVPIRYERQHFDDVIIFFDYVVLDKSNFVFINSVWCLMNIREYNEVSLIIIYRFCGFDSF